MEEQERLITTLQQGALKERLDAVVALGQLNEPKFIESLLAALKDPSTDVRRNAVIALRQFDDPRIIEPLISCLDEITLSRTFSYVIDALRHFSSLALEPTITALDNSALQHGAVIALGALGALEDPLAVQPLLNILKNKKVELEVRKDAALSLGYIGSRKALPVLKGLYEEVENKKAQNDYFNEVILNVIQRIEQTSA